MYTPEFYAINSSIEQLELDPTTKIFICTPISVVGSYPTPVHSVMAVFNGKQYGTVGGGNIEFTVKNFIDENIN